jgi:hypothetical protein
VTLPPPGSAAQVIRQEQQSVLHKDGPKTEIEYRLAWAKTYLKGMGLLDNSTHAVFGLRQRSAAQSSKLTSIRC